MISIPYGGIMQMYDREENPMSLRIAATSLFISIF